MIQLYLPTNTNYDNNGDIVLIPSECTIEPEINGTWELTMSHPIDKDGRWKFIEVGGVISAPSFNGVQLFRITEVTKDDASVNVNARPIFLDSVGDCFVIDKRPTQKTGQEALDDILSANSKYSGRSDITKLNTAYYVMMNAMECIASDDDRSFLKRWGGEIIYNNHEIIVNERCGGDYGVELLYGKNIPSQGMSQTINTDDVVTRVIPKAFNGHYLPGDSPWVDSPLINNYPTITTKVIEYENIKLATDVEGDDTTGITVCETLDDLYTAMRTAAAEEFSNGNIDKPIISIQCDMVLLENTEEYKRFKDLERVGLGDTIHCRHDVLDIETDARVVSLVYDSVKDCTREVTIGEVQVSFVDRLASTINSVEKALTPSGGVLAEQIEGFIDGAIAQLRLQNSIAKKLDVRAILTEDTDTDSATFGAMSLGTQGFQISHERTADGRDWVWTTSATGEGIIANTIVAGILSDKLGRNFWNLNTGQFSLQGANISNSTIDGYTTVDAFMDAIEDLQNQIDGKVDTWFYSGVPSLTKPPVTYDGSDPDTGWDTDEKKRNHIGDVYYDTDTNYAYRFAYENGAYSWQLIEDTDVTEALETAREALALADTKMQVFISQPTTPYDVGDLWFNSATSDIMTCIRARATGNYTASDWQKRNKYIDTATVDTKINTYNNSLNQQAIFNKLTNNGQTQGIYLQDGKIYINGEYIKSGVIDGVVVKSSYESGDEGIELSDGEIKIYRDGSDEVVGTLKGITYGTSVGPGPILVCELGSVVALGTKIDISGVTFALPMIAYQEHNNYAYIGTVAKNKGSRQQKPHFIAHGQNSYVYGYDENDDYTRYIWVDGLNKRLYLHAPDDSGFIYLSDVLRVRKSASGDMLQVYANGTWRDGYDYNVTIGGKTLKFANGILFDVV